MKSYREKLVVLVLVAGGLLMLLQSSLLQRARQALHPSWHTLKENTLSSTTDLAWSFYSDTEIIVPPKGNDELVVILDANGRFVAVNNISGEVIWEYTVSSGIGFPWSSNVFDLDDDLLITSLSNNTLLALDTLDGHEVWRSPLSSFRTTPDILIMDNVVIVTIFSTTSTEGYIAIYELEKGDLLWEKRLANRSYEHTFRCPYISEFIGTPAQMNSNTVCLTLFDRVEVIDASSVSEIKVVGSINQAFPSNDLPYYQAGIIYTNPNPNPRVQYYNLASNERGELPASCQTQRAAQPVTPHEGELLIANGCNELFILQSLNPQALPEWIFRSDADLAAPFVTTNGKNGFLLNSRAEIIEVNLSTGELLGILSTTPSKLQLGKLTNSLVSNALYLYAIMDGHTLFVLQTQ